MVGVPGGACGYSWREGQGQVMHILERKFYGKHAVDGTRAMAAHGSHLHLRCRFCTSANCPLGLYVCISYLSIYLLYPAINQSICMSMHVFMYVFEHTTGICICIQERQVHLRQRLCCSMPAMTSSKPTGFTLSSRSRSRSPALSLSEALFHSHSL
jgi:hypothetical protein